MNRFISTSAVFAALMFVALMIVISHGLGIHLCFKTIAFSILSGISFSFCLGLYDFLVMIIDHESE